MKWRHALVVVVALLAISAQPAAAANASAVASQHTTTSELADGSITNGTVTDGTVSLLGGNQTLDSFEDGITSYGGDTSGFDINSTAYDGSQSLEHLGGNSPAVISDTDVSVAAGDTISWRVYLPSGDAGTSVMFGTQEESATETGYSIYLADAEDTSSSHKIVLRRWDDGSLTTLSEKTNINFPDTEWLRVEVDWQTDGRIDVTVFDAAGNTLTTISATDTTYSSGGIGFRNYFSSLVDNVKTLDGTTDTAQYISAPHDAEEIDQGWTNLTLSNASATVTWQEDADADGSWTNVTSTTYTSSGNVTADLSGTTTDRWRVRIDFNKTDIDPVAKLHDEGVLFDPVAPSVSNLSPTGEISQRNITLSADLSDTDFGLTQSDSVTVEFFVDNSSVGTDSLSANGTASVSYTASTGGSHDWYVVASDSYNESTTSPTATFKSPSVLYLRREGNPDELVDSATVRVTAYYGDKVRRENISDGSMNLTGFPIGEPIIIRTNASGYYTRTAVIESVYQQNSAYLLSDQTDAYLLRYQLQDLTGEYPESETVLFVERDLKRNGSVEWRTIAGDNFGVEGVPVNLRADERYRIRIKNLDTNQSTVIGAYTAIQNETVTLSTGSATIQLPETDRDYTYAAEENETAQQIIVSYEDSANQTESLKITIHERFNESNVLVDNASFSTNDLWYQTSLTANQTNKTWVAELYVDRGNGYLHFRVPMSGGQRALLPSNLESVWVSAIGVFILLISAMAFSELNQGVGAITTSLVGGVLWWFGIFSPEGAGVLVVIALAVSVGYHYYTPTGGGDI